MIPVPEMLNCMMKHPIPASYAKCIWEILEDIRIYEYMDEGIDIKICQ